MKNNIHLSIMLSLILCGCTNRNPSTGKEFATRVDVEKNDKVSIYDFFSKMEIIPLETVPNSIMAFTWGQPYRMIMNEGKYYFLDRSMIFVFDAGGKFLKKIDHRGEGPEEYIDIGDFNINRFNRNLEILSHRGRYINVYDSMGNTFIERIQLPNEMPVVYDFQHVAPDIYIFDTWADLPELIFFNRTNNEIVRGRYKLPRWIRGTPFSSSFTTSSFYLYNDTLCFGQIYSGDVFMIFSENYELRPRYRWDFGKYNFDLLSLYPEDFQQPAGDREFKMELMEKSSDYASLFTHNKENSKYYISNFAFKEIIKNLVLDKTTGKHYVIEGFLEEGLVPIIPMWMDEEAVYEVWGPENLKRFVKSFLLDEENSQKYPQIKEDDNGAIVKYYFK